MNTTHDLRDALRDQERHAPAETDILAELHRKRRPHQPHRMPRMPRWGVGLLAAAAVAAIVIGVSTLAGPHTSAPVIPAVVIAPATNPTPTSAVNPTQPTDLLKAQQQLQSRAEQAAQEAGESAVNAAEAARVQAEAATKACTKATSSADLMVGGHLDATSIAAVVETCAAAYGARAGYTAQWVQTTVGALSSLTTGQRQRDTTPIVAVQIHGAFTAGGQGGETETMMLVLSLDLSLSPGTLTNGNTINLATLGAVHHL